MKDFSDKLIKVLKESPYHVFVFTGFFFVIISLISRFSFDQTWVFFIYAAVGIVVRYIERDFISMFGKLRKPGAENIPEKDLKTKDLKFPLAGFWIRVTYHVINAALLVALLLVLSLNNG